MANRRSLTQGLKATPKVDTVQAKEFIYGKAVLPPEHGVASLAATPTRTSVIRRTPFSSRLRDDFAKALKTASLQRQLGGIEPNTVQDILEEALEPWLKANGYLT